MRRVIFLGTASAVTLPTRDYTSLVFKMGEQLILVDTGTNVFAAMQQAGINPLLLEDIILTHRHIDHLAGLPALFDQMRLAISSTQPGLKRPIRIFGLPETIETASTLLDTFAFERLEETLDISLIAVAAEPGTSVLTGEGFSITAYPAVHAEPCMSVRIQCTDGTAVAYSADTQPHPGMKAAYTDLDLLIHECTFTAADAAAHGPFRGHCSTADVAAIAHANAPLRLVLVHLGWTALHHLEEMRQEVAAGFHGTILVPQDGDSISF